MTIQLFEKLQQWQQEGCRCISIEIDALAGKTMIWCYDYDLQAGDFVKSEADMDDLTANIKSKKRAEIMAQLDRLA